MERSEEGFFVHCGELTAEEVSVGVAVMTTVKRGEIRGTEKLYLMIPVEPEQAKQIERIFLEMNFTVELTEIGIDRDSQDKIEREG